MKTSWQTHRLVLAALLLLTATSSGYARAEEALVTVASNFRSTFVTLQKEFEERTDHRLIASTGSTGHLYAQIVHGAPVDLLLAGDQERPRRLESEGLAVEGSRFTYAVGRLVLWTADPTWTGSDALEVLASGDFRHLAIANPDLAPYGAASRDVLRSAGLERSLLSRLVMGENVVQTFALVATENAELGLVALSLLHDGGQGKRGRHWEIPAELHAPIRQDALLLSRGETNAAAVEFFRFLRSDRALHLIADAGYEVP